MKSNRCRLYNAEDLEQTVLKMGFLPFFQSDIPEFSIEEFTPKEHWFADGADGPWEWKSPVAGNGNCAYGKLFRGKAGFVSMEWFPELVNYRRAAYPLDTDPAHKSRLIYDTVVRHESLLSKEIKTLCGFRKPPRRNFEPADAWNALEKQKQQGKYHAGFDTLITRLQMGTWLVVATFEYEYDKHGQPYGWGIARYVTPEALFGEDRILSCNGHSPEESKMRLAEYFSVLLPQASETQILRLIG